MIRQNRITELVEDVKNGVDQLFAHIVKSDSKNNLILLLANGHKVNESIEGHSPYVIGPGEEGLMDFDRTDFFQFYTQLPFENQFNTTEDSALKGQIVKHSLHFELMIYTHFWEALPVLKIIKQLCNLCEDHYDWEIDVPLMGKHTFIRDIRNNFESQNLDIHSIITKGFHSQIRNAFAHSQYSFSDQSIFFGNYEPNQNWQIPSISITDWEDRFLHTALLFNEISRAINEHKSKLEETGPVFDVLVPETENPQNLIGRKVRYRSSQQRFIWEVTSN